MSSTSFPYLAIAKRHHVPYGEVIRYVQFLDKLRGTPQGWQNQFQPWKTDTCLSWCAEQERRKQVEADRLTQALTVG